MPCILDDEMLLPLCEKLDQLLEKLYGRKFVVQECDLELLLGLLRDIIVLGRVPGYRVEGDFIVFEHSGIVYAIHAYRTACFYAQ